MKPRIALIHATPVAIDPVKAAFASVWPEADTAHILDESLTPDRARTPDLTAEMFERFEMLTRYARHIGSAGVLFTCSAFGEAIDAAAKRVDVPVLKPNEAMFEAAIAYGSRIGMVATFAPAVPGMEEEFRQAAMERGSKATLRTVVAEGAMAALRGGDEAAHNRLVAEAAGRLDCDAVMLAHFSTSRALASAKAASSKPVLTSPEAAVAKMRSLVR